MNDRVYTDSDLTRSYMLEWAHGRAEVQALNAMLGPVEFRLPDGRSFEPLYQAPWPDSAELPTILRRMRGEWPCVPFGRTTTPAGLPGGWTDIAPDDDWLHGFGSNAAWDCVSHQPDRVVLAIDYPEPSPVRRLVREVSVVPDRPALEVSLTIEMRQDATLPVALHPTFRVPSTPGSLKLEAGVYRAAASYPAPFEPGVSLAVPDRLNRRLEAFEGWNGDLDLTRLPLAEPTEELVQLLDCGGEISLHYLEENAAATLSWDATQLPDAVLWISNRGRRHEPWNGRNLALGVEPVNGLFELGRVAAPPADHPLASRRGLALRASSTTVIRYRITAAPLGQS